MPARLTIYPIVFIIIFPRTPALKAKKRCKTPALRGYNTKTLLDVCGLGHRLQEAREFLRQKKPRDKALKSFSI